MTSIYTYDNDQGQYLDIELLDIELIYSDVIFISDVFLVLVRYPEYNDFLKGFIKKYDGIDDDLDRIFIYKKFDSYDLLNDFIKDEGLIYHIEYFKITDYQGFIEMAANNLFRKYDPE